MIWLLSSIVALHLISKCTEVNKAYKTHNYSKDLRLTV